MYNLGILTILPVLITLVIVFWKRNVFSALSIGIIVGAIIIDIKTKSLFGFINTFTSIFTDESTIKTVLFILISGAIMYVLDKSGGVEGMARLLTEKRKVVKSKRSAQFLAQLTGIILFVDATSSIIVSSLIGKPFWKKFNIPKEKLALISNSTGSPIAWLIPFGGAGVLTAAIINKVDGINIDGFSYVIRAIPFQFYTIIILLLVTFTIFFDFEIGKMNKLINREEILKEVEFNTEINKAKPPLARNMVIPLVSLIGLILIIMYVTGNGNLLMSNGSSAVFISGIITLVLTGIYYRAQGLVSIGKYIKWTFEGMKGLLGIVLILILSFIFSNVLGMLGTAKYLAGSMVIVPNEMVPVFILVLAAIISFSTGTSSGTVAILAPLAIPLALNQGVNIALVIGAIISGAVFGDQNSPISDSVILTSTATGVDIMTHVKTQLPYTILSLGIASILYIIIGCII